MKIFKIILIFLSIILLWFFLKPKQSDLQNNLLIVGTSLDYPPYEYIDIKTGNAVGFDIDVVTEIARRMQKELRIVNMPFSTLIFSLLSNEIMIIAAGMSPTERRSRIVSFSKPYLEPKPLVIFTKVNNSNYNTLENLHHKKVAVGTGHMADIEVSKYPEINVVRLESSADCFNALKFDSVDAVVEAESIVRAFLDKQKDQNQFCIHVIAGTSEKCALAINKNNTTLLEEIDKTLHAMHEDNTLKTFQTKWNL